MLITGVVASGVFIAPVPTPVPTPVPVPVAPTPVPVAPTPVPVAPTPVPVAPTPVAPTPVAPTPVAPTPVAPTPVAPTPVAPTPVAVTCGPCESYSFTVPTCLGEDSYVGNYTAFRRTCSDGSYSTTGCTAGSTFTGYGSCIAVNVSSCGGSGGSGISPCPTPVPVAPTPVAPIPVCNNYRSYIYYDGCCNFAWYDCNNNYLYSQRDCGATCPGTPTPVAPTPVAPTPVAPTPVAPTPVAPTPVAPTPVACTVNAVCGEQYYNYGQSGCTCFEGCYRLLRYNSSCNCVLSGGLIC